jgi:uncharacterized membrane protein
MPIAYSPKNLARFQSLIALFLLCLALSMLSDKFLTFSNLWNVMRQISVNICISVGMTLIVLTAGIDLSVGYHGRFAEKRHSNTFRKSVCRIHRTRRYSRGWLDRLGIGGIQWMGHYAV